MPNLSASAAAVLLVYYLCLAILSCLGLHRGWLLWERRRLAKVPRAFPPEAWPPLLLQLPLYNEPAVVERLVESCVRLRYSGALTIQVLDDSTDETTQLIHHAIERLKNQSPHCIQHIRRSSRTGFKAGALAEGLALSSQPYVAILDADFVPEPDFLEQLLPELLSRPQCAFVQARWEHLNRRESLLTRAQASLLDGHFRGEHAVRSAHGFLFNFNGTAGIWRREAIASAGGWTGDTLTEDFDLSYRARIAGWSGHFVEDLAVPAELPAEWSALFGQQSRWSRGSLQCARKLLSPLWRSKLPLSHRLEATVPLLANLAWPLVTTLMVLSFPVFLIRRELGLYNLYWLDLLYLLPATLFFFLFYASLPTSPSITRGSRVAGAGLALLLGIALSVNNARAALVGLFGPVGTFRRTPKKGGGRHRVGGAARPRLAAILQFALFLYLALLLWLQFQSRVWIAIPFTGLFALGTLWGSVGAIAEFAGRGHIAVARPAAERKPSSNPE